MKCSCVNIHVGEEMTMLKEKFFNAVKSHVCGECGRAIKKGEKYLYEVGSYEGNLYHYKTCADCKSIRDNFFCNGWWYGNIMDDIRDHIEYVNEISEDCLVGLTPRALGIVCDIIEEGWVE